jgi:hypothetical protein
MILLAAWHGRDRLWLIIILAKAPVLTGDRSKMFPL